MEPINPLIEQHYSRWYPMFSIDLRIEEDEPVFRLGQSGVSFAQALVRETDTAVSWIERSDRKYFAKIIYKADDRVWKERLPGEGKDFGEFDFFSCKWIRDHLFLIYQGRWQDYHICSFKDFVLRYVRAEGERVLVLENALSYQNRDDYEHVRYLTIPELEFIEELSREEAKKRGLMPEGDFHFYCENAHGLLLMRTGQKKASDPIPGLTHVNPRPSLEQFRTLPDNSVC